MGRYCEIEYCSKYAKYGYSNKIGRQRCSEHKLNGMIDKGNLGRICIYNKCNIHASYGYEKSKAMYCKIHAENDMRDVISKRCIHCNNNMAIYTIKGGKRSHCKNCALKDMVFARDVFCEKCKSRASYGYYGKEKKRCSKHKDIGMIHLTAQLCKSRESHDTQCEMIGNDKYDYYCTHCFSNLFPYDNRTQLIRKKSKELQVVNYISTHIEGFYHDKPLYVNLEGGCCPSKRRIDLRKLINGTLLCIEIDENQHRGYHHINEEERYNDLYMDFSGKYIFIRFNPDHYKDHEGNYKNPRLTSRLPKLLENVKNHINRINSEENQELVEIYHLYYDKI